MKLVSLIALLVVCIAQWIVPVRIIRANENILSKGKVFRFLTEPIDPSDPFIGKYISLRFKEQRFSYRTAEKTIDSQKDLFVILGDNDRGFAKVVDVTNKKPGPNVDFVIAKSSYIFSENNDTTSILIYFPFDKFYMDEYKAPKAEKIYRSSNIDSTAHVYAIVSVLNGDAVIQNVMINDKPIAQSLNEGAH